MWGLSRKVQPCSMKNRHLLKKTQDTRNTAQRTMAPQAPSKQAPWDLTQFSQWPSAAPSYLPESHRWSAISSLSKVILVLGKARSLRAPNLGYRGLSHPGDLISPKKLCTRCDVWVSMLLWWNCQPPVAHGCGLLSHPNSFHLTQNVMQVHCSTHSVILNVTATQYTYSVNGVYHPHWLVQWSCHCSHMGIPVHSAGLPGYINAALY